MERAERADKAASWKATGARAYEEYGWMVLAVSAILGAVAAALTTLPPLSWFIDPLYSSAYSILGALGATWVGFSLLALVVTLIPYRRGEWWAWYTLWMLPLMWLTQFALAPDLRLYLALAIVSAAGLILPYRRFFSRPERPQRVR